MQNQKDQAFDFLTKFPEKISGGNIIYHFIRYLVKSLDFQKLVKIALVSAAGFGVVELPYYGYKLIHENHVTSEKAEAVAQVTNKVQQEQQVKIIEQYTPQQIDNAIGFLKKMQTMESKRLTDLFWKIKFVESKSPDKYNLSKSMRSLSKLHKEMMDRYTYRINDISSEYAAIKTGHKTVFARTYDDKDVLNVIIYWVNAAERQTNSTFEPIDNYLLQWDEDFTDKAGLAKYLEDHKALIEKSTVFNSFDSKGNVGQ
jgi:hypothetical protein